jgi:uroporphyrinogen decarboxylase
MAKLTPTREKYFSAMRRQSDAYVPFEFNLCPALLNEFEQRTARRDYSEYYAFPTQNLEAGYIGKPDKFLKFFPDKANLEIDPDWGVGHKKGSVAHFTEMQSPMKNFEILAEFESYPYPDAVNEYDWSGFPAKVRVVKDRDQVAVAAMQMTIFEIAWYLRGMETFLMDLLLNPDLANYHLDRITAIRCEMAERYAAAGCDVLSLGDDVSTQLTMMMKVATWREYIKPRLAKVIEAVKKVKPDILIFYHGDGNLQAIIPELIEIGVEILNPIQPECMDPVAIKKQYGDRLSFWGAIGTQTVMPFGSPQQVREVCEKMIREVGRGGGLGLAPTHVLEPEVPWENIQAFVDVVKEHNIKS